MSENRRTSTRHAVELVARISILGEEMAARIENLSLGGALLIIPELAERPPFGTRADLEFSVSTADKPIKAAGVVRWSTERGVGLQFDGLRAAEVWALNKFFEDLPGT